jgi:pyruvate/2-oxoglutarate dehydrogenase complex dihydrolipoamide acyltransferase (E2) component
MTKQPIREQTKLTLQQHLQQQVQQMQQLLLLPQVARQLLRVEAVRLAGVQGAGGQQWQPQMQQQQQHQQQQQQQQASGLLEVAGSKPLTPKISSSSSLWGRPQSDQQEHQQLARLHVPKQQLLLLLPLLTILPLLVLTLLLLRLL